MKEFEINSEGWSDEQIKQAFAKLEELGYKPSRYHGYEGLNGKRSISALWSGEYCGYDGVDGVDAWVTNDSPTFEELMNFTKADVK